jgi:hypothetical protein
VLAGLVTALTAAAACKCDATYGPCREAVSSNVIFVGTVESVSPTFLDTWNESQKASLELLTREYEQAKGDHSAATFGKLRDAYVKVFPDLPEEHKRRFERASSPEQLTTLFYWILDHGKRVRFTVRTTYRYREDADDDEGENEKALKTIEIWTPFGECGVSFQVGETYLVYADSDEESDVITTTACHRTRRVSEAGDDLAFLYFRKNMAKQAGRIEAFVTRDAEALKRRDGTRYSSSVESPVAGAVVEADDGLRRVRADTDEHGRGVFDGLTGGEYRLTAYAPGYPTRKQVVGGPQTVKTDKGGCATAILLIRPIEGQ